MLDKKYDFKMVEQKWQQCWQDKNLYHFNPQDNKPKYTIDTPPPTISGPNLHTGHLFSYTQIDVVARHKRMDGFEVFFPMGFDNNGLPSGRYVQKKYNLHLHNMSRSEFVQKCLEEVEKIQPIYEGLFKGLGFSCDMENTYSTISPNTQKISQQSFIQLYNKGEIVRRDSANLWCPECKTAIALSEIETAEVPSVMNYIYFGIEGSENKLEIATTRPELLSACVCVFVNPESEKHSHLIGKNAISPIYNKAVPILANPEALMDKGTGVVMCCTFGDEKDMEWQKAYNLPVLEAILPDGKMSELAGSLSGMKIKEARAEIIKQLTEKGLLFKQEDITHLVGTHERCGHHIEILTKPQWFVRLLEHKNEIYKKGLECNWYPKSMQKRFLNWVEGLKWDWCISRQNFFGVPFPVWYCSKCGKIHFADISELPVDPTVTQPTAPCECGSNEFIPESDVMDTWATSSLTPQLCMDTISGKGLDDAHLPMSLRPNAHDNIRVWDFYTITKSLLHFNKLPWTDVMISGYVIDERGDKISKSKGNEKLSPHQLVEQYSADVVRYWTSNISMGMDTIMSMEQFQNGQKLIQKIWNASKFVLSFLDSPVQAPENIELIDRWIINELKITQRNFERNMEKYEIGLALKEVERLFWNFCDNYIEIAKNRLYKPEIYGEPAKQSAQYTSSLLLQALLKMFSIYIPHITEEIYMKAFAPAKSENSIHCSGYLKVDQNIDTNLSDLGASVVEIVSAVRGYKSQKSLSLKTEVEKLIITGYGDSIQQVERDIKAVGSVKNIAYKKGAEKSVQIILAPTE